MLLKILICYNVFLYVMLDFTLGLSWEVLGEVLLSRVIDLLPNIFLGSLSDFLLDLLLCPILDPTMLFLLESTVQKETPVKGLQLVPISLF